MFSEGLTKRRSARALGPSLQRGSMRETQLPSTVAAMKPRWEKCPRCSRRWLAAMSQSATSRPPDSTVCFRSSPPSAGSPKRLDPASLCPVLRMMKFRTTDRARIVVAMLQALALCGCRTSRMTRPSVDPLPSAPLDAAEDVDVEADIDVVVIVDAGPAPTCDDDGHGAVLATFAGAPELEEPMLINWTLRFPSRKSARRFARAVADLDWRVDRESPKERTVVRKALITAESLGAMHEQVKRLAPGAKVSCWALGGPTEVFYQE